ncbi:MAG: hypothetical protein A3K19_02290 [Lentisphaerae bacterium RIFOXYB12_FULL_65_16]|nr:MAG: hypothetical protein A3K18_30905 [Lentisphaerae bacterium RIFOXYA12_64_32]OGV86705.1 MAG: hypothetical protein A3K19_02290 [Lentisphaerae bacterium RIFOXYB12_FULL_65_16]
MVGNRWTTCGWAWVAALLLVGCGYGCVRTHAPVPVLTVPTNAVIFYVSPAGKDSWSGTLGAPNAARTDGPLATLAGARDAVRALKAKGPLTQPVVVWLRGGKYYVTDPVVFGPQDSGTEPCPITYAAFPRETPELIGGRRVTGFQPADKGQLAVLLPEVKDGTWSFRSLFVNGERQIRARYPNFTPGDPYRGGFLYAETLDGLPKGCKDAIGVKPDVFKPAWLSPGAELHIFQTGDCRAYMEILSLVSYDAGTGRLQLGGKEAVSLLLPGDRYTVQNVHEELDSPGEWYLNPQTGMLFYQPGPGFSSRAEVVAPTLGRMLDLQGDAKSKQPVSYLRFFGLTFRCTDWALGEGCAGYGMGSDGTIFGRSAIGCAVENCTFTAIGKHAVSFHDGEGNRVAGCDISHTGGGGVMLMNSARNTVTDNHIHHVGEAYKHTAGVILQGGGASENVVSHNAIHDTSRYGISMKGAGTANIIEFNFVQNTSLETYDTGSIEVTQGDRETLSGTKIRGNLVLDSVGYSSTYERPTFLSWGIYLDSFAGGYEVTDNVCARSCHGGIMLQGGKGNTVRNNIFVDGEKGQGHLTNYSNNWANEVVEGNIFAWHNSGSRGFACGKFGPDVLRMDRNLYGPPPGVEPKFGRGNSFAEWQALGFDQHGAIGDPRFVGPEHDDYRLKPDSPALAMGFKPLALSRAGLVGKRCTCKITPLWPEFWAVAEATAPAQGPKLGVPAPLRVAPVTKPPTIDGVAAPGEWPGTPVTMAQTPERQPISGAPANAYICYDDTTLYVAVTVPLKTPTAVHREGPQGVVDETEVVFRDASGAKPGPTFSVLGLVSGKHELSTYTNAPEALNRAVDQGARFAAQVGTNQWTGEWAIPLAAAGITMRPGLKLGFNLGTFRSETNEWLIWVGALASTLELDGGGMIVLE